jgi:hypothetical protein
MIRGVTFASCYVYSPLGAGPTSERSRLMRALLKENDSRFMPKYADRVRQQVAEIAPLAEFFGEASVLIPIPGSAPRPRSEVSVADRLAWALLRKGLGHRIWPGLHRVCAVRKSATAPCGLRPTVSAHYESFAIDPPDSPLDQIMLVDDVVTKGRTLLAAAWRLHDAHPQARIRAFALVRTMGLVTEVDRLIDPCIGRITWKRGDACREP